MKLNVKDLLYKTHRFFKSLKLTATVIALLILVYFLGLIMPQKWMFDTDKEFYLWRDKNILNQFLDVTGLTDIYLSPLTIALLTFFFINLLVVTLNRVPVILKRAYLTGEMPSFGITGLKSGKNVKTLSPDCDRDRTREKVQAFFKKQRWFFKEGKEEGTWIAIKNRLSPIGFLLFHFSFFLCLIGSLMISYTRFSGKLPLTEGQKFEGNMRQFRTIDSRPKIFKELPPFELKVEKVHAFYESEVPTELVVSLIAKYGNEMKREILRINEPAKRGSLSIIAENIGVSPLFIVRDRSGNEIDGAYVALDVLQGKEDFFWFEKLRQYNFHVKFYPDLITEKGIAKTKSIELKNPAMSLIVKKQGEEIYAGTIMQGEQVKVDDFTMSFVTIRYWVEFLVVREYGKFPLIAGFAMAAIGLIMRLVFYQKRIRLAIEYEKEKPLLYLDGRSEYFKYSFEDEMDKLVRNLDEFLKRGKGNIA